MDRYRFLKHTADAKFQAFGNSLEEAFSHAALALVSLMWDWHKVEKKRRIPVHVKGRDLKQLLVGFLEEILYLLDTQDFLLAGVEGLRIEKKTTIFELKATLLGDTASPKHEIFGSVKAITYNEMEITENPPFLVQVVADI
ncbi:MAG: archease [Candidatus Aminicenantales bacterium]